MRLVEEHTFWDRIPGRRTLILAVPAQPVTDQHRKLRVVAAALSRCGWITRPWTPDWFYRLRLRLRRADTPLRRLARECELTFYKLDQTAWESILIAMAMNGNDPPEETDPDDGSRSPRKLAQLPSLAPAE
jgi:hypothetical protein